MKLKIFDYWQILFNKRIVSIALIGVMQRYLFYRYVADENMFPRGKVGLKTLDFGSGAFLMKQGIIPQSNVDFFEYYVINTLKEDMMYSRAKDNEDDVSMVNTPENEFVWIRNYLKRIAQKGGGNYGTIRR